MTRQAVARSFGHVVLTLAVFAATIVAHAEPPKAALTVSLQLCQRMYPRLERPSPHRAPGLILYPEYCEFTGSVACYGSKEILKSAQENLQAIEKDAVAKSGRLFVRIVRLEKNGTVAEQQQAAEEMAIHLDKTTTVARGLEFQFRVPSKAVVWEPGQYRMELGVWYREKDAARTIGAELVYFEVRRATKGTGDEINLLSNGLMEEVPGLSQRLLADKEYVSDGLAMKILAAVPHDVLARYALVRKAEQLDADPGAAVSLWKAIQKDVAEGTAQRAESLANPLHTPRPTPITKEMLEQIVATRLQAAKIAQERSVEAKAKVDSLVRDRNYPAVIALFDTGNHGKLSSLDNVWLALWAIRTVKDVRLKSAHETLVAELGKLPPIPALWQIEIVDALASIHADDAHGHLLKHTWAEGTAIIEWWLARPASGDVSTDRH